MSRPRKRSGTFALVAGVVASALLASTADPAAARDGLGVRLGLSSGPDQLVVGGQAELGPAVGSAFFTPSVDLGFGDGETSSVLDLDLRWYLLRLPETGIRFYGQAGPTLVVAPNGEIGLSLAAGADIPMRRGKRYNLEARFGLGDVPELKIVFALLFGL